MNTNKGNTSKGSNASNGNTGIKENESAKSPRFTARHRAGKTPLLMHSLTECTGEGDCIHEQGLEQVSPIMASVLSPAASTKKVAVKAAVRVAKKAKRAGVKPAVSAISSTERQTSTQTNTQTNTPTSAPKSTQTSTQTEAQSDSPNLQESTNAAPRENRTAGIVSKLVQLKVVKKLTENNRKVFTGGIIATLVAGVIAGSTLGIAKALPANTDLVTFVTGQLTDNHAEQLSKAGKTSEAILEYEKAIQQSPNDLTAYKKLGAVYEMDAREYDKAVKVLKDAVMINDSDSDIYRLLAYAQFWAGQNDDAAKSAQKAIDLRRGDAMATSTMALIVAAGGDFSKGKDLIQQALNTDGNNSAVVANGALFYRLFAKDFTKAEELIRNAIKMSPENAGYYWELSCILKGENKKDDAEAALRKSFSLQPDNGYRASDLADYLSSDDLKKYSEGADMYRKAIALGFDDAGVVNALGCALFNSGKYAEAAIEYQKVVQLEPTNANHVCMLGRSQFEAKNYADAKDTFTKLVGMDGSASSYNWLGCANFSLGDYNSAISNFSASLKLNNTDATVWANLASAQDKLGNTTVAAGYAVTALDVDANNSTAWVVLDQIGNHMIANNQKDLARDLFQQVTNKYASNDPGRAQVLADLAQIQ